jgi:hypothetical protein
MQSNRIIPDSEFCCIKPDNLPLALLQTPEYFLQVQFSELFLINFPAHSSWALSLSSSSYCVSSLLCHTYYPQSSGSNLLSYFTPSVVDVRH